MQFHILIFDGFDEMDVFGVFEALRMANFRVEIRSLDAQEFVTGAYGAKLIPDGLVDLKDAPDVLIVPGGGWISRSPRGAWKEAERGTILQVLHSFHSAGHTLASVCAGSMLLGKAGLLTGRAATSNSALLKELRKTGAEVIESRVVDDGDIITAGGITSSLDLGLWLIERFGSKQLAIQIAHELEFEPRGPVSKKSDRQS